VIEDDFFIEVFKARHVTFLDLASEQFAGRCQRFH